MEWFKKYRWPWLGFILALGLHLWHLGEPAQLVSDEVFFVQDGWDYVTGQTYFDPHPPLGKEQLGVVFTLFGYTPFTWRIINAVEGALVVPLIWWLAWRLTRRRAVGNLAMLFVLLNGLLLTESRLGLINVPYVLYGLAALAAMFKALEVRRPWWWLVSAGVMIGAAVSTKWLALAIVVPTLALWYFPRLFGQHRNLEQPRWIMAIAIVALVVIPAAVYWLAFRLHFGWLGTPDTFLQTNLQILNYNLSVPATGDPYAQSWWGWLLAWQPFPYWSEEAGDQVSVIRSLPNPWLWWTGVVALVYSLIRGWRQSSLRFLNIFLLFTWLPFGLIQRVMYSYHTFPFGLFLMMLLAVLVGAQWERHKKLITAYAGIALIVWLWFLPWYLNLPLSSAQHKLRRWLPHWTVSLVPVISSTTPPPIQRSE